MSLYERFRERVEEKKLFERGEHVLVAVSGGVDSVVLLHLLLRLRDPLQLSLTVAHLNHKLRGFEADADQAFVTSLAEKWELPIVVEQKDVRLFARAERLSEEEAARLVRYDFLFRAKEQVGADCVATAHQADDQVETVIDHFIRGSGLLGLSGMCEKAGGLVRPLLFASRAEIEEYAKQNALSYRTDRTNYDVGYRRNRIRLELIPYIRRYFNPGIKQVVLRTAKIIAETEAFLAEAARSAFREAVRKEKKDRVVFDCRAFTEQIEAIQKYLIILAFEKLGGHRWQLRFDTLERVIGLAQKGQSGAVVELGGGIKATRSRDELAIHKISEVSFRYHLYIGQPVVIGELGLMISAEYATLDDYRREKGRSRNVEFVDADKVAGQLYVRNARRGDRFYPLGGEGSKTLSDFFIDEHVPVYERWRTPVVEDQKGIVWVCGYRLDDRYKVDDKTKRVIRIQLSEVVSEEE